MSEDEAAGEESGEESGEELEEKLEVIGLLFYLYDLGCFILMSLIIELTFLDNDVSRGGKELKV